MLNRLTDEQYSQVYQWAIREKLIDQQDNSVIFFDFDILNNRLEHLRDTFPEHVQHAIAIKTCPLIQVLKHVLDHGYSLEAASFEELQIAQVAGAGSNHLVFDSPAKTRSEISQCSQQISGAIININTLDELERFPTDIKNPVGIRINPLVKADTVSLYNVSGMESKFGVPISRKEDIIQACLQYPFINGLHIHIGSQLKTLDANIKAIGSIIALADEIEQQTLRKVEFVDIGGGFPANYGKGKQESLDWYVNEIQSHYPDFFQRFKVITEYGRFVYAHTAWLVSHVEYLLKHEADATPIAIIHNGGDMFPREIYQPNPIRHQITVLEPDGNLKTAPSQPHHIGGPLCYGGDFLGKNYELPKIEMDDKLVVADIGANTFSLWSRHCSRSFPKVIGYSLQHQKIYCLKKREDIQDIIRFWGG